MNLLYTLTSKVIAASGSVMINDTDTSIQGVIVTIINYALFFVGVAAVAGIVYSGALFIMSAGNPEKLQKAKSSLLWSVMGIIIVALSFLIVGAVFDFVAEL